MKFSLDTLLKNAQEKHSRIVFNDDALSQSDPNQKAFLVVSEYLHSISLFSLVSFIERNVYSKEIADLAISFLYEPSIVNLTNFQTQLFTRYRILFGQVFPFKFQAKDLLSLYLKKYLQILEEFKNLANAERETLNTPEAEKILFEALTFFGNNFNVSVAMLKPSNNVPEGPEFVSISNGIPLHHKLKSLSHQIEEGMYFIPESGQPLKLNPFLFSENGEYFILRMLTKEGAFCRSLNGKGFRLFLSPQLLLDYGEILFKLGAYEQALVFYRSQGSSNREILVVASALAHCVNSLDLLRQGEPLLAAAELELALAIKPELPVLYHDLSSAYQKGNNLQQAASVINKLLEKFPISDEGYIALGDIYASKGDWARANRAYEKSLSINPFHPSIAKRKSLIKDKLEAKTQDSQKAESSIEDFLENFSDKIKEKQRETLFGREEELKNIIEILSCKDKKNALIVGEAGIGKTLLIEEFISRVNSEEVPSQLKGKKCWLLNAGNLIAGARFRGQFEERVLEVIKKVKEKGDILVVENIHQLVGASGSKGGSLDSSSLIKPYLSKGEVTIIGTTDSESFSTIKDKDPSFLKFFHPIMLEELPFEIIQQIIIDRKTQYENFHNVTIPPGVFENVIELVKMSISDRGLPESILDLMDRSCAAAFISFSLNNSPPVVTRELVLQTLSEMSGISYERLSRLTPQRLLNLEALLAESVIGQEEAISKVSRVVRASKLGFDIYPYRPDGVLLFVGPTGVGKTELAKTLAKVLFGDEEKLIRIDMSEYMERISTSRLIGTSPGYVGYYDPNQLTDKIRKNPYSVMLFDEIEKADPQVLNLFLQIFDAGRLTDGRGRTVRFNHTTVIMTSNLGTDIFVKGKVGYKFSDTFEDDKSHVLREVRKYFTPEFLNRIDEIVVFKPLSEDDVKKIVDLELEDLRKRLKAEGKELILTEKAKSYLAKEGYSYEYGARNLSRVLRREVGEIIAEKALEPQWEEKEIILLDCKEDSLFFSLMERNDPAVQDALVALSLDEEESIRTE